MKVLCPYCDRKAELVSGIAIYPHREDLYEKRFYRCVPCDAYVGCHPGTVKPLGRLANAALRREKRAAHAAFDPLWRNGGMTRADAYAWLAQAIGISKDNCHIGMMDVDACMAVVVAVRNRSINRSTDNETRP